MQLVRSLLYGYLGAILAGLAVGLLGLSFGLPESAIAATATPVGIVCGLAGLLLAWRRPLLARLAVVARRSRTR